MHNPSVLDPAFDRMTCMTCIVAIWTGQQKLGQAKVSLICNQKWVVIPAYVYYVDAFRSRIGPCN